VPCLIYHPLLQRSESRFLSFNAWLVDGKIQIESNLPLVTYSADSPHSYRIHSMVQRRFPMKFKTFYKINSCHFEIYLFLWMLKSPLASIFNGEVAIIWKRIFTFYFMSHTVDFDPCSAAISIFHINSRSFKKFKVIALANGKSIKFLL
jgi:hypothetical protein